MVSRALSRDDIAFGRAVLLATDAIGMSAEGAFWLQDPVDKEWKYYLVTSLFSRMGARSLYKRLNEALPKKLSLDEIQQFTFYIAMPDEPLISDLRIGITTGPHTSEPMKRTVKVAKKKTKAVVYRLTPWHLDEAAARSAQRRFSRISSELEAA